MYKIKTQTNKRFFLGWIEITPLEGKYHPAHGYCSTGGESKITKKGFGGIGYALKYLNKEITIEGAPEGNPAVAGVEGGPASELAFWFKEISPNCGDCSLVNYNRDCHNNTLDNKNN